MQSRIAFWALAGFVIAAIWAVFLWATFPTIFSRETMIVARLTCPIALVGDYYHFGVSVVWVLISNAAIYGLLGLALEPLWHLGRHAKTAQGGGINT